MRRPGSYYFITLLNKSENVQVTLLVRFLFIKHSILTTSLYRNSNEKKEVHIIECYRGGERNSCFTLSYCPTRIQLVIYVKIFRVKSSF